jgi:hypothetical protein
MRGGKLLIYHRWADLVVPSENSIEYYNSVTAKTGEVAMDFIHLFMVPGMNHCDGGVGASTFDALGTLDSWIMGGKAPEWILAPISKVAIASLRDLYVPTRLFLAGMASTIRAMQQVLLASHRRTATEREEPDGQA